jgi:xanthine dehydrogenase accessory factor
MIVFQDGRILGTIGGGYIENEVRREASNVLNEGRLKMIYSVFDNNLAALEGMVCSGQMEVLLEPLGKKVTS